MDWLASPDYWLSRFVFQRALGAVYLVAFLVALNQFRPLLGEHGLLPVPRYLRHTSWRGAPTLFRFGYSDRRLLAVAWLGIGLALCATSTLTDRAPLPVCMLAWLMLWVLYLSIVNVGQVFYSFGWESLLLEAGFLAVFLGSADTAPPLAILLLLRWLLFRLEFGAGLIKLRGDRCWRDLTCLDHHHETQPMPNRFSRLFHHLPRSLHRIEVLGNHAAQLVAPPLLFAPQPVAGAAATFMALTQLWLVASGNFSWLNALTIALALSVIDDAWLHHVIPVSHGVTALPLWFGVIALAITALVLVLSWWPARNMASPRQHMNASFNSLHLVNTYGAFGTVTRVRNEVIIEGTDDEVITASTRWRAYEFKGKPGDVRRKPPQVAPYHLRLDWLMWFAAMSPAFGEAWLMPLVVKLLENDAQTLRLIRGNPFPDAPPTFIRISLYRYRFTTWREHRQSGDWWLRRRLGLYLQPVRLQPSEAGELAPRP